MAALLLRQWRAKTLPRALWSYGLFLFVFFFVSRFLNENYLGYIAAFLALIGVVQLMPSLMLLLGFVKGLLKRTEEKAEAQAVETHNA